MMRTWIEDLATLTINTSVVRAVVIATAGSTPRNTGAAMLIGPGRIDGTIGGGALEHDVIARAREMLAENPAAPWLRAEQHYHLGPALAQCCGGAVTILLERYGAHEAMTLHELASAPDATIMIRPIVSGTSPQMSAGCAETKVIMTAAGQRSFVETIAEARTPLIVYGAGHVGRALVRALIDLPFDVTWMDIDAERFPATVDDRSHRIITSIPSEYAAAASTGAFHLVMTHDHALDETIVAAILSQNRFGYLGLIGSATKRARFRQRLLRDGHSDASVARLVCPIGLPGLTGKAPAIIAASVTADLLLRRQNPDARTSEGGTT